MSHSFPNLFSGITIGQCTIKNRIVSTGHHTYLADSVPNKELIAYHHERAKGGAGLIISEIVATHPSAGFSSKLLTTTSADSISAYSELAQVCHQFDTKIFAQLFHPGREILSTASGMLPIAWAPSAIPNERFHIMPKAMPIPLIREIIASFGQSAAILSQSGFDGFEIVASHGYLPVQFLNPNLNLRNDEYGGDKTRRLAFLQETIAAIRINAPGKVIGLRISADDFTSGGMDIAQIIEICSSLESLVDYFSVVAGTSAGLGSSVHITPPMGIASGYLAPLSAQLKSSTYLPVIVTGRINQPQDAERIISDGNADLCGMTRALICDPLMPNKTYDNELESIRSCIGCNQACIGRAHKGLGISCIQYPESGRETEFPHVKPAFPALNIMVVGSGPAGLKAAATAAARGHQVTVYEQDSLLGGQARLAMKLPGRESFGGIIDNLVYEARNAGVSIVNNSLVDSKTIEASSADHIILATGAKPYIPDLEGLPADNVSTAWQFLTDPKIVGSRIVLADWRADWIGIGIAEMLAVSGCDVTLYCNAALAGETLQIYTRNHYVGRLHKLGVRICTHRRLFGFDGDTAYFQDTLTEEPVAVENVDQLILSLGHVADDKLEQSLHLVQQPVHIIGDGLLPRTAEEAVFEGLQIGTTL